VIVPLAMAGELFDSCDSGLCSLLEDKTGALWDQPTLLGDAGGWRTGLGEHGIKFDASNTLIYQGVTSGGTPGDNAFQFGGRNDYYLTMDAHKLGLWEGLIVDLHGETRYGETMLGQTGSLSPANMATLFPVPGETETALTQFKLTQFLSEQFLVYGGKINFVDGYANPFAAGKGQTQFVNTAFCLPPMFGGTIPVYSSLGAGFAILRGAEPIFSFLLIDPVNHPTTSGFDDAFSNGVGILANLHVPVTIAERPGHQDVFFAWSNKTRTALDDAVYIDTPDGPLVLFSQVSSGWTFLYGFDQYLVVNPCDPKRGWGVFGQFGVSDGNPNPIRFSFTAGVGGSSPICSRPADTFGVGYYFFQTSTDLKNTLAPVGPIGNEHGVELYYNIAVTPWFHVTPDIQWIEPASGIADAAVIVGVRTKIDF
jgi:porin